MTRRERPSIKPGTYRHYKGNLYAVIDVATDATTQGHVVVYRALYETPEGYGILVTRPYEEFIGDVEVDGVSMARFTFQGDSDKMERI